MAAQRLQYLEAIGLKFYRLLAIKLSPEAVLQVIAYILLIIVLRTFNIVYQYLSGLIDVL